jgi:cytochrome c oxidase subunit 2
MRYPQHFWHKSIWLLFVCLVPWLGSPPALAQAPRPWEMTLQPAASPVMERITSLYDILTYLIIGIVLLVLGLLAYVILRFNAKRNPTPATFHGNLKLEILWTLFPILILAGIATPSFRLLYYMDKAQEAEMTLKVIGHQWYWSYAYPDNGGIGMDSFVLDDASVPPGQPRLLDVDNRIMLPIDTTVRLLITSDDVIHSFSVPSLGLKTDAVPGRLNESWVRITKEGIYYGQCSQLCGVNHGFMPVAIQAVTKSAFTAWVETAQKKMAAAK